MIYCIVTILQFPRSAMTQGYNSVLVALGILWMLPGRLREAIFWMCYLGRCVQCASNNSEVTVDRSTFYCTINAKELRGFQ